MSLHVDRQAAYYYQPGLAVVKATETQSDDLLALGDQAQGFEHLLDVVELDPTGAGEGIPQDAPSRRLDRAEIVAFDEVAAALGERGCWMAFEFALGHRFDSLFDCGSYGGTACLWQGRALRLASFAPKISGLHAALVASHAAGGALRHLHEVVERHPLVTLGPVDRPGVGEAAER